MLKKGLFWLVIFLAAMSLITAPFPDKYQAEKSTLKIIIMQDFPGNIRLNIKQVALGVLQDSGIKLIENPDESADLLLKISLTGKPLGGYYVDETFQNSFLQRDYHYSGASVSCQLEVSDKTETIIARDFYSSISPPQKILKYQYQHPTDAPFYRAFDSGLFFIRLGEIIAYIYGDTFHYDSVKNKDFKLGIAAAIPIKKDQPFVESLIMKLKDAQDHIRLSAIIRALGKLGGAEAREALVKLLDGKNSFLAAVALAEAGDIRAISVLEKHPGSRVTVEALSKISDNRVIITLLKAAYYKSNLDKIIDNIKKRGPRAIAMVESILDDEKYERDVREGAAKILLLMNYEPTLTGFQQAFNSNSSYLRHAAISYLSEIKGEWVVELYTKMLQDRDDHIRWLAVYHLYHILTDNKDQRAVQPLLEALNDSKWDVRTKAMDALGEIGDTSAVKPLIKILKDKKKEDIERAYAASALGRIKDPRAVKHLIAALKSGDPDKKAWFSNIRGQAITALGEIGDPRAVKPLLEALNSKNAAIVQAAAEALGKIDDERTIKPLINVLKDSRGYGRQDALEALGKKKSAAAVTALIEHLNYRVGRSRYEDSREVAAKALTGTADPRGITALFERMSDEEEIINVRRAAMKALSVRADQRIIEALIKTLQDKQRDIRETAARLLGKIKAPQAVGPLISALADDGYYVRMNAAESLGAIADAKAIPALLKIMYDKNKRVREAAFASLKKITGLDFGSDNIRWQSWWEENKDNLKIEN